MNGQIISYLNLAFISVLGSKTYVKLEDQVMTILIIIGILLGVILVYLATIVFLFLAMKQRPEESGS